VSTAVVAYSGGLDTSCILAWLKEDWYGFDEVVAVLVDVGQEFDVEQSIVRAKAARADDVLLVDRKDAFAEEQCARAIVTNALYEGKYPLVSALSRPVIAEAVAAFALELGAEAVVHGCTGKGNDQLRFELAFRAHYPGVRVIAPGCGACIGCGPGVSTSREQVTVSAINRNYQNRSGPGRLYLASPLTVAASAVAGHIVAYREGMFLSSSGTS